MSSNSESSSGSFPKPTTPRELQAVIYAERRGAAFVHFRDHDGGQVIVSLEGLRRVNVGRNEANDLALPFDESVSGLHAVLEQIADEWTVEDDGLSRNGSFLNGLRLQGRQRLRDGDWLRFGHTTVAYRMPASGPRFQTSADSEVAGISVTAAQQRVLIELCRPQVAEQERLPATNRQIADRLVVSTETVKSHLRELFGRFGLDGTPAREKRAALVDRALQTGAISARNYEA